MADSDLSGDIRVARQLLQHPLMFLIRDTFECRVAYLQGYCHGSNSELLTAFREWLIPKLDRGNETAWPGIVLMMVFPGRFYGTELMCDEDARACEGLTTLLDEFFDEVSTEEGARAISTRYQKWLESRSWSDSTDNGHA